MIAIATFAALIIQTYDHQMRVVTEIEPAACEMMRCQALFQKSCGAQLADGVDRAKAAQRLKTDQAAWEADNPKTWAQCKPFYESITGVLPTSDLYCGPKYGHPGWSATISGTGYTMSTSATREAWCLRQRGDK